MTHNRPADELGRYVLATDLDGTLIPLEDNEPNRADLHTLAQQLHQRDVSLVFVTGRHFESVVRQIDHSGLPQPDWIICDVGTSIFQRQPSGELEAVAEYQQLLQQIIQSLPIAELRKRCESFEGLRLQEQEKQGRFKLSYYTDASRLDQLVADLQQELERWEAPYSIIQSVDPFTGDGLIDFLPAGVSKAHALDWWTQFTHSEPRSIVFAGDSGNDLAALTAGYRAILVGNADRQLAQQVYAAHRGAGWKNRLYLADRSATSGLLEGCRWFGLAEPRALSRPALGATPVSCHTTLFRVWAPRCQQLSVKVYDNKSSVAHPLQRDAAGWFSATVASARPGDRYEYVLDEQFSRPDPASRYQPQGVHHASQIIDAHLFPWTDDHWQGVGKRDLIIYELHVGTFTREGTFRAAIERLEDLVELGITAVELMPVTQSPGRWNWGYDGVNLFAVRNTYGEPDDLKAFVDACHAIGLAVILDVVYNHVGPEGNYLADFGPYFSRRHHTPWGEAFNYDGRQSGPVRQFVVDHALFWLDEYHLDGLRLDAVHFMLDDSPRSILDEIRMAVTEYAQKVERTVHLIAETNVYDPQLLNAEQRPAYDAIWCDCLMHAIYSRALPDLQLTHREYRGASDLADVLKCGYVFAGPEPRRVAATERDGSHLVEQAKSQIASMVTSLQNHDGIGNHPQGKRIHQLTSKAFQKAAAGLTLLFPSIPLLFMGEPSASASQFPFFVDYEDTQLRAAVDQGRKKEYPQHSWDDSLLPSQAETFYRAKCGAGDDRDHDVFDWYRKLIQLRKAGTAEGWLSATGMHVEHNVDHGIFSLRFNGPDGMVRLVQTRLTPVACPAAEPLWLPAPGAMLLSSEPATEVNRGQFLLQPNHAVVFEVE